MDGICSDRSQFQLLGRIPASVNSLVSNVIQASILKDPQSALGLKKQPADGLTKHYAKLSNSVTLSIVVVKEISWFLNQISCLSSQHGGWKCVHVYHLDEAENRERHAVTGFPQSFLNIIRRTAVTQICSSIQLQTVISAHLTVWSLVKV